MRRSTGAIFRDSRPATIIRSDWRGEPRKTSAPKRAMSYRDALIAIISMAQQARPNVTGQIDERRAQRTTLSTVVVRTGISKWSDIFGTRGFWIAILDSDSGFGFWIRILDSDSGLGFWIGTRDSAIMDERLGIHPSPIEHALAPDVD